MIRLWVMIVRHLFQYMIKGRYGFWLGLGLISSLYLFLMSDNFFFLVPYTGYDDGLQFLLAQYISAGEWLGPYNNLTLAKGITYPLWMALLHIFDIPLWFGNAILYVGACLAVVLALRPAISSRWILNLVYILILFNPFISNRAYRDSIAPALCLLLFAWIVGFFLTIIAGRQQKTYKRNLVIFSIIGAVGLNMWWFLREDSFWILPFVITGLAVTLGYYLYRTFKVKSGYRHFFVLVALAVFPFVTLLGSHLIIGAVNNHYYGRFVVNDYTSPEFQEAYGALTRIEDDNWQITVPVSEMMRKAAYEASPAFRELKPCLDSEGKGACEFFRYNNIEIANSDYEGGWFFWALRLAAQKQGYYENPTKSASFFMRLADEINTACDTKKLECEYGERAALTAPLRSDILDELGENSIKSAIFLATLDDLETVKPKNLDGYSPEREVMANYLKARYHPGESNPMANVKRASQQAIGVGYAIINTPLLILAIATLVTMTIRLKRFKDMGAIVLVGWAILLTLIIRVLMLAYVETTSFPAIITLYFSSVYPLMFLFEGIFAGYLMIRMKEMINGKGRAKRRNV